MIHQGELYWLDPGNRKGSASALNRPHVVVQNDILNASAINTTIVCGLTTNLRRAGVPSNVALDEGEGGLAQRSVVNVSQIITVDKTDLEEPIGQLSRGRMQEIIRGLTSILEPL